jgi:hypothetical protein
MISSIVITEGYMSGQQSNCQGFGENDSKIIMEEYKSNIVSEFDDN